MKARLYSIRTQQMELDRRILEQKSTVLEQKQSEIKVPRVNTDNGNPQVMDLLESLKRKEAEVEDLKHQPEDPVKDRQDGIQIVGGELDRVGVCWYGRRLEEGAEMELTIGGKKLEEGEMQKLAATAGGGMKLEMQESSEKSEGSGVTVKSGFISGERLKRMGING
ncbi:hypothetical protein ACFX13_024577 [Malus domestica]